MGLRTMHPARFRALVGTAVVVAIAFGTALLVVAPAAALVILAVAFAASAAVAGADSRQPDAPH